MDQDRCFYLDCIRERFNDEGDSLIGHYYQVLCRPDEVERYWWLKSVFEVDIHRAMVACSWNPRSKLIENHA